MSAIETLQWVNGVLRLVDQTLLPNRLEYLDCRTVDTAYHAIQRLVVRGAPAIGIAAAYGVCLAKNSRGDFDRGSALAACERLATSRPTAVNLFWALDRMRSVIESESFEGNVLLERLIVEASNIHREDREMCYSIGQHGAGLLNDFQTVLTHCNAGGLAASIWGTALAPIYYLQERGKTLRVIADETRPLLQGARLTAWELHQAGIPVTVCTDSMAGGLMRRGEIDAVIVGADRIAANGDVANKIGTYPLAVLARYHGLPFYVAAPSNSFDLGLDCGDSIPIEQRGEHEVAEMSGIRTVPLGVKIANPAFDITPASLITAIVTELGIIDQPAAQGIAAHFVAKSITL